MKDATAALAVDNIKKSYGTVAALKGVTFSLDAGTFNVLLGPNGAGKSTLFQILSGLFTADEGDVYITGLALKQAPVKVLAELGIVFQQATLDLDLSARDNLVFHARLHGIGGRTARERIDTELERLGLTADAGKPCRALSGGNRRKVELARALLHEPAVLLMDEPTVGLDPASRRDLLAHVLEQCRTRSLCVLWATHLVDEAHDADRLTVLHQGQVSADGPREQVLSEHGVSSVGDLFFALTGGQETRGGGGVKP